MSPYVTLIKNFITKDTCKRLIELHHESTVKSYDIPEVKKYSYSGPDTENALVKGVELQLKMYLEAYVKDCGINDVPDFIAGDFKILEYNKGDFFSEHYDGDFSEWPEGGYRYHPFTSDIALNDRNDYVGGEFDIRGERVTMNAGDLLIFPTNYAFKHRIHKVHLGTRYAMVSEPYSLQWGLQQNPQLKD